MGMRTSQLKGQVALIAGGTGEVGKNIARAFLRMGATVAVPSRSAQELENLRDWLQEFPTDELVTIFGDVGKLEEAERIRGVLETRLGRLDAVVALLGGWQQGVPLVDVSMETWEGILRENLTTHFVVARTFLPMLMSRGLGSYTLIVGGAAETPVPLAGPCSVAGAAQLMLARALSEELKGTGVRLNEIILDPVESRNREDPGQLACHIGDFVGTFAAWLASERGAHVSGTTVRLLDH
jgi:NAD(P)-dependent dehydrogenase (short-subunit alcohol dehydrogenase family)